MFLYVQYNDFNFVSLRPLIYTDFDTILNILQRD